MDSVYWVEFMAEIQDFFQHFFGCYSYDSLVVALAKHIAANQHRLICLCQ